MGKYWAAIFLPDRVDAARKNVAPRKKGRFKKIDIRQWDARQLPLETGSIDKVATNLPFGKQVGAKTELAALYPALIAELGRVLTGNGRAVLLSSEYDLVKESVRQQPTLAIVRGYSVSVLGQWGRIYIIDRTPGKGE